MAGWQVSIARPPLDCQPVGNDKAIIYKNGFREEADYSFLVDLLKRKFISYHKRRNVSYEFECFFDRFECGCFEKLY
jgi:hypothetical protein